MVKSWRMHSLMINENEMMDHFSLLCKLDFDIKVYQAPKFVVV